MKVKIATRRKMSSFPVRIWSTVAGLTAISDWRAPEVGAGTVADAILDRLVTLAHQFEFKGGIDPAQPVAANA